ncbi:type IV toxin-antitoxin system AbiEi family antitoxin [Rhodococcus opacus]|uniref:type IV toxin-antitoxin system AbiEi family antitoxin n=1 Tax=Rhodococcus opacus TaxID=37919 RepID=UPI00295579CB|nr:type IV toxin-antitoxin system AbiEi family antitoxin [Rhodococcus opacus]
METVDGDRGFDATAVLSRHGNVQEYLLVFTASMTFMQISHRRLDDAHYPILVVGERITERSATSLRDLRIQYIDNLGNAYIEFGDVYIDVRGRRPKPRDPESRSDYDDNVRHEPSPRSAHNLFSPRRSQVVFALLTWPHLAASRVRDIATAAGVSMGQAHDTLSMLDDAGFLHRGTALRSDQVHDMLRPWAAEYPRGLRKKLVISTFQTDDPTDFQLPSPEQDVYLSGESATGVAIHRPATLTVYLDHFNRKLAFVNRWRNEPHQPPNVTVMQKFWTEPDDAPIDDDTGGLVGPSNAPWPLVYADLLAANDPRLNEVADTWRDHHA